MRLRSAITPSRLLPFCFAKHVIPLVVFCMRIDVPNIHSAGVVVDDSDQSPFIAANVKDRVLCHPVRCAVHCLNILKVLPFGCTGGFEPRSQWVFRLRVPLPELPQWASGDDMHTGAYFADCEVYKRKV